MHTHLHARCFLFYADQDSAPIAPQTAIVGSSDLTRAGLLTNAELNVVHRARLAHEDIALKRLRGLLEREERTLLLQCSQEQRLLASRLPTLLLPDYGAPIKQHGQAGEAREETQPPHKKHSAAPLSGPS
ncbi:hypothetical protein [Ktedonobacter robiniae]|uniref:hypothetical protein n=1 Tax=Ktedonobacter robiniae TaxID=2778365 RepID=UPI001F19CC64|nr:hypothetical protein [Ktedonobacter robiniae]